VEPVLVRPGFSISDLDVKGARPQGFTPLTSIYEILDQKPNASICLARVSSIGDIILLFPVFYRIKELYPECRLSFASVRNYLTLIKYIDFIEPVEEKKIALELPDFGYDFNITVERAERQGWGKLYHRSEIYARILGIDIEEYRYAVPYSDVEKASVLNALHDNGYNNDDDCGNVIGFQLRGASDSRSFPIDKVKRVIRRLAESGNKVILLDGDRNMGWSGENIINMCGAVDVLGLVALIDMCDLAVSTDSGVTHIAGAVGKTNVAFFGCIPAKNRVKYPNCCVVNLAKEWGCENPCWESGERCGQNWSCLADADENMIFDRIMEQMN
jgi:ADP-heptose:LPS heptosyltransferase